MTLSDGCVIDTSCIAATIWLPTEHPCFPCRMQALSAPNRGISRCTYSARSARAQLGPYARSWLCMRASSNCMRAVRAAPAPFVLYACRSAPHGAQSMLHAHGSCRMRAVRTACTQFVLYASRSRRMRTVRTECARFVLHACKLTPHACKFTLHAYKFTLHVCKFTLPACSSSCARAAHAARVQSMLTIDPINSKT